MNNLFHYIKEHKLLTSISLAIILVLSLSLAFYAQATMKNFSSLTVVLAVCSIALYALGAFFDSKGIIPLANVFLTGFCFGYYLTSRLESINLIQVNLSDINVFFYVDLVLWIIAFALAILFAVLDTFSKKDKVKV